MVIISEKHTQIGKSYTILFPKSVEYLYLYGNMPSPKHQPREYLTKNGRSIFFKLVKHIQEADLDSNVDIYELTMLANSFDLYEAASERVRVLRDSGDEKAFGSSGRLSTDYQVMEKEYNKILKHGPKYGLNPGDRHKIFGGMKKKKKADPNSGLD